MTSATYPRPSMRVGIATPAITATVLAGIAIAAFLVIGPANIGGPVVYMVISGNSMEPGLHRGDMVFVRTGDSAAVGDAVAYRSTRTGQHVLHRVIGMVDGRFIFQGDNNSWVDSSQPTQADLIGKLWFHVPRVGTYLEWLRSPLHAAVMAGGMVAMATYQGMKPEPRKLPREMARRQGAGTWADVLQRAASPTGQTLLGLLLGVVVLACGATAIVWQIPATHPVDAPLGLRHRGSFEYSAETILPPAPVAALPGIVDAPSDLATMAQDPTLAALLLVPVTTGQPFFMNVHPKANFAFHYELRAPAQAAVSGTIRLDVVLSDVTGWKRAFPFAPEQAFTGNTADISAPDVDLALLMTAFLPYQAITGHAPRYYLATLIAVVETDTVVDGVGVHETFRPSLEFRVVPPNEIYVETESTKQFEAAGVAIATNEANDPFAFSQSGVIPRSRTEAHSVPMLGADVGVRSLRMASAVVIALAALGVAALVTLQREAQKRGEIFMIHALYGRHLVLVEGDDHQVASPRLRMQVASMDDLLRLAHIHNAPILVTIAADRHRYFVRYGDQTYAHDVPLT